MARHILTQEEQLRGCEKALKNPKTPKVFIPSLQKRAEKLRADLR